MVTVLKTGLETPRFGVPVQFDENIDERASSLTIQSNTCSPSIQENSG